MLPSLRPPNHDLNPNPNLNPNPDPDPNPTPNPNANVDKDASVPADGKAWAELSAAEQQAASTLGYTEHSWDAED